MRPKFRPVNNLPHPGDRLPQARQRLPQQKQPSKRQDHTDGVPKTDQIDGRDNGKAQAAASSESGSSRHFSLLLRQGLWVEAACLDLGFPDEVKRS